MAIFTAAEDLKAFLGANIIAGLEVTDLVAPPLNISWVEGQIFNASGDIIVDISAGISTVADDDTTYIKWVSGSELSASLSTATGNEVLVATVVAAGFDITSITEEGFDFSSVSGLSGRPVIRLLGDKEPPFFKSYGQIIIDEENLVNSIPKFFFRKEDYRLVIRIIHDDDGPAVLKNIIDEIDSSFRVNNKLHQGLRTYHYDLKGSWDTNYRSTNLRMLVDARKDMEVL